jgi:MraZ protein
VLPFTGTHACTLDDKKGLALPASVREQLGGSETLLLTPGCDGCVWLASPAALDRLTANLARAAGRDGDARRARRLYFAQSERAAVDGAGRLALPPRLAECAGLGRDVVLIGVEDHFEVWDAARWQQYSCGAVTAAKPAAGGRAGTARRAGP